MTTRVDIPFVFLSPGYIRVDVVGQSTPAYSIEATAVQGGYTGTVVFATDVTGVVEIWEEVPLGRLQRFNTSDPVAGTILDAEFDWLAHQIMNLHCEDRAVCWQVLDAATLVDLKAMPAGVANTVVLRGGTAPADGNGGVFVWDANSSRVDDGINVISPDTNPGTGRWLRITAPYSLP